MLRRHDVYATLRATCCRSRRRHADAADAAIRQLLRRHAASTYHTRLLIIRCFTIAVYRLRR